MQSGTGPCLTDPVPCHSVPLSFGLIRFCFPLWRWDIPLYLLNVFKLVPSTKLWQLTGSHIRIWYSSRPDAALLIWRKTFSNVTITMFLDRRSIFVQRALHALCTVRNTRDGTSFFRPFSRSALMIQWNRLFFRSKNVYWDDACSVLSYVSRYVSTKSLSSSSRWQIILQSFCCTQASIFSVQHLLPTTRDCTL